ncbi:MAG: hypothetical protein E6K24_16170 [Gammaproteobacteria bacterium]|nr:MAG: hypothetical protein E6K24_16170 [Gammaproteobacteria bacterium]
MGGRPRKRCHPAAAEPSGDGLVGPRRRADREARGRPADAPHVHLWDAPVPLTAGDVAEILRLLEESEFDELHIEQDGLKLTLKRGSAPRGKGAETATAPDAPPAPTVADGPAGAGRKPRGQLPATAACVVQVTAPFVGIFHRAPKPGAPPYIEVGSEVQEDTIIGIIEVMKLMNAVRAEARGTVVEILVVDGAVVEYGQALVRISRGAQRG